MSEESWHHDCVYVCWLIDRLHCCLSSAVLIFVWSDFPVISLIWSIHLVGDLPRGLLPSTFPWTISLSKLSFSRREMCPKLCVHYVIYYTVNGGILIERIVSNRFQNSCLWKCLSMFDLKYYEFFYTFEFHDYYFTFISHRTHWSNVKHSPCFFLVRGFA